MFYYKEGMKLMTEVQIRLNSVPAFLLEIDIFSIVSKVFFFFFADFLFFLRFGYVDR